MKFIVCARLGNIILIFGHVSQLKQAVFRTIVEREGRG